MEKLVLLPSSVDYSFSDPTDVISTTLEGGAARYRKDLVGAWLSVKVTFLLNREDYSYFRAFYRTIVKNAEPFLIDLITDSYEVEEHTANFVPGTLSLSAQQGLLYTVTVSLEVKPLPSDSLMDASTVALATAYGSSAPDFLNELSVFVNETLPENLA